eukprot:Clim_evm33s25 gene=Clim_evmTU33s25
MPTAEQPPPQSISECMRLWKCSHGDAVKRRKEWHKEIATQVLERERERSKTVNVAYLRTGSEAIDALFPGFATGLLHEVVGESGAGKTQLMLQLCAQSVLRSGKAVIYVGTEGGNFPSQRYRQICAQAITAQDKDGRTFDSIEDITDRTMIFNFQHSDMLIHFVEIRFPALLAQQGDNVGLIVIDSIAALFRSDYDSTETGSRAIALYNLTSQLKAYAHLHNLVVVCSNQVSAIVSTIGCDEYGYRSKPTLGLAWANMTNSSLRLAVDRNTNRRHCRVIRCDYLDRGKGQAIGNMAYFSIGTGGIV